MNFPSGRRGGSGIADALEDVMNSDFDSYFEVTSPRSTVGLTFNPSSSTFSLDEKGYDSTPSRSSTRSSNPLLEYGRDAVSLKTNQMDSYIRKHSSFHNFITYLNSNSL